MALFNVQQWLVILNGAWGTAAVCLGSVMIAYLRHEGFARRSVTKGMRVACAVLLIAAGVMITRYSIYSWRIVGARTFSDAQLAFLLVGGVIGTIGFVWATGEYSEPLWGRWVWILSAIATVTAGAGTALYILH